jgi:hypothetical protein
MELKELASDCWFQLAPSQGFILGLGWLASTAAATAAAARTGGRETHRGPACPRRPADAAIQRARSRGT